MLILSGYFKRKSQEKELSIRAWDLSLNQEPQLVSMRDTESEPTIFYNQVSLLEVGLGHQLSHKIFDLKPILPARYAGTMEAQNL